MQTSFHRCPELSNIYKIQQVHQPVTLTSSRSVFPLKLHCVHFTSIFSENRNSDSCSTYDRRFVLFILWQYWFICFRSIILFNVRNNEENSLKVSVWKHGQTVQKLLNTIHHSIIRHDDKHNRTVYLAIYPAVKTK